MKHKTKTKTASEFALRLKPKAKRYQHLTDIGRDVRSVVQLPPSVDLKGITVQDGGLVLKVKCKRPWTEGEKGRQNSSGSRIVAMMFLSLYQVLNLSRRMTKKAG